MVINHPNLKVHEGPTEGTVELEIVDNKYAGVIFTYGRVSFEETGIADSPFKMNWEYQIRHVPENLEINENELELTLFTWLCDILTNQLETNEVIYAGGTDSENRENNS